MSKTLTAFPGIGEGSFGLVIQLPWPWPPQEPIQLLETNLSEGKAAVRVEPSGRFIATISSDTTQIEVSSCVIHQPEHMAVLLLLSWSNGDLTMRLNKTFIGSTSSKFTIPHEFTIEPRLQGQPQYDFSEQNLAAKARRRSTMGGTHPKHGRNRSGDDDLFVGLNNGVMQARDLLAHIRAGRTYHVEGLAGLVRKLIADTSNSTGGLLQWCAAIDDQPLIIYTVSNPNPPDRSEMLTATSRIRFNAATSPVFLTKNPIDLDVWLKLDGTSIGHKNYCNAEVLHIVGSTIAAHFDVDKHQLVEVLRSGQHNLLFGDMSIDFLVNYICKAAELSVFLADQLLARKKLL